MFCHKCGNKLNEGEIFCDKCGAKVEQDSDVKTKKTIEVETKKFYETTWFSIIMIILFAPIGVFLMWKNKTLRKSVLIIITIIAIPITFLQIGIITDDNSNNTKVDTSTTNKNVKEDDKYVSENKEEGDNSSNSVKKENMQFIEEPQFYSDGVYGYIEGVVKNNTGKSLSYIEVRYKLYDNNGNQLDEVIDNTTNISVDGTWKFKVVILDISNVDRYEFVGFKYLY